MGTPEPRVVTIEGRRTLVVDRHPPLPSTLQLLIEGGRDATRLWAPIRLLIRRPLRLGGTRPQCEQEDHRLADWLEGFHNGSDGITRYLRILVCQDCGGVCVRDNSFDHLANLPIGGQTLRRKDHVIGWYSGARRNQRVYSS